MSTQNNTAQIQIIRCSLDRMGIRSPIIGHQVLQGGISGSYTCRVQLDVQAVVLKTTLVTSQLHVFQRALREFEFYRTLAGQIPLRTPRLIASCRDDEGVYLLLAAYRPPDPAAAWTAGDLLDVAAQLARFHARFWRKTVELDRYAWLRQPAPKTTAAQIGQALSAWQTLKDQPRLQNVLTDRVYRSLVGWVNQVPAVDAIMESFPLTLCHGDCHIGNLLRDEQGGLVWADWQEVGLGRGPEDLSFLLQRAAHDGGQAPVGPMIAAYREHLERHTGEPASGGYTASAGCLSSAAAIEQVMDGSELRVRLLEWPYYLQWASVEQVAEQVARIETLAGQMWR